MAKSITKTVPNMQDGTVEDGTAIRFAVMPDDFPVVTGTSVADKLCVQARLIENSDDGVVVTKEDLNKPWRHLDASNYAGLAASADGLSLLQALRQALKIVHDAERTDSGLDPV